MGRNEGDTHIFRAKHHKSFRAVADSRFKIFGVAGESKSFALYVGFIDRRCHEHVDFALAQVGHGTFERYESRLAGHCRRHARLYLHVLAHHIYYIIGGVLGLVGRFYLYKRHVGHFEQFAVVCGNLGGAVDYRSAQFKDSVVLECFEYHFVTYAVDVAVGYSHTYLSGCHFKIYFELGRFMSI